jgi:protein-tyrosine phosphatase
VDDGSKSLEESLEMLRVAAASGATDIVATPHANYEFAFEPEVVARKVEELRQAAGDLIRIHSGCDFHLSFDNIRDALEFPTKYSINHKNYLLVEFSGLLVPDSTDDVFHQMLDAGIIPIITHPERNAILQRRIEKIEDWVRFGCLVQVTGHSFLGRFGKQAKAFADLLLRRDLIHIVASDAHDVKYRPPSLKEAFEYVSKQRGSECAGMLFASNPGATLTGVPIQRQEFEPAPAKKWYQFWSY